MKRVQKLSKGKNDQMNNEMRRSDKNPVPFVIFLATLIGAVLRGYFVFQSDFPLNDGGMFFTMIQDLQAAHYHLPFYTSYNLANIPFAYPPLPFYFTGLLNSIFRIDLLQLIRFLPLIFSILTLPAFYFLAKQVLKTVYQQVTAVFIFAVLPGTYLWQIMGGGITRSMAFFFMMLALAATLKWAKESRRVDFVWMILWTALTTLCHLEMLWMLVLTDLLILVFYKRTWKGLLQFAAAAFATLVLISPWWVLVITRHGGEVFVNALHSGYFNLLAPLAVLLGLNPNQFLVQILFAVLAVIGVFLAVKEQNWFLPAWWFIFILLDPRSVQRSVTLPIALLAALTLEQFLIWVIRFLPNKIKNKDTLPEVKINFSNPWIKIILIGLVLFTLINNLMEKYSSGFLLNSLNADNRTAMAWVKENTPSNSQFLVIDFPMGWAEDMAGEWFPTLTSRVSLLTIQGQEWLPDQRQINTNSDLAQVSACCMEGVDCLQKWAAKRQVHFDYVYFTNNTQNGEGKNSFTSVLESRMLVDADYSLVYENADVRIFQKR